MTNLKEQEEKNKNIKLNKLRKFEILKSVMFISLLVLSMSVFAQDKIVLYSEVPDQIQAYIKKHFPNNKVLQSKVDYDVFSKEYKIYLSDSIKLEFNEKDSIKSIDAKLKLPDSVIPLPISNYVKSNYSNNFITEWGLDKTHQSVELNNGVELEFTLNGDFMKVDD